MPPKINIFQTKKELAESFVQKFLALFDYSIQEKKEFNILLSGGRTPNFIYKFIAENPPESIDWKPIHFFWGDERCVPSDYPDSNFGEANKNFFKWTNIPMNNIHPIVGESHPYLEADRYSTLVHKHFKVTNTIPSFDLVVLGLGEDGHVASLFPNQLDIFNSNRLFEVSSHPESGQQRITVTGKIINNAANVFFLVTGKNKSEIVQKIINNFDEAKNLPASLIKPEFGNIEWFLDKEAASQLE